MSGIYINGMEMPKNCCECLLAKLSLTGESLFCNYTLSTVPWDERPFDCPLSPVPDHGRLIAAFDAVKKLTDKGYYNAAEIVSDMPTIIPASGGNENE